MVDDRADRQTTYLTVGFLSSGSATGISTISRVRCAVCGQTGWNSLEYGRVKLGEPPEGDVTTKVETAREFSDIYHELQRYVRWDPADVPLVQAALPLLESSIPGLIDDFYEEISRHPRAAAVITGGAPQIERLKTSLRRWLRELFDGEYADDFVAKRWQVGRRHVEIGLDQYFVTVALSRLRSGLCDALHRAWQGDVAAFHKTSLALMRLLDLDTSIMQLAYHQLYSDRLTAESQAQLHQSERLATIGQMVTGLAHESRNILQRSHACLETLILDIEDRPEALKQARRIQSALDHLHLLYEEVRNFAAPIVLDLEDVDMRRAVVTAWQHLEPARKARAAKMELVLNEPNSFFVRGDRNRIDQVFTNLLQNAMDACLDRNEGTITCQIRNVESPRGCEVVIEDNGCGLGLESGKAFEPFVTTKPKGTGLGLAITKRIIDAHQGSIRLENSPRSGALVTIRFPLDPHGSGGIARY